MSETDEADRSERRRYQRYAVRCDCWLERDEVTLYGTTADVGLGGIFLRSAVPMGDAERVEIKLSVAGGNGPVMASGKVTRAVRAQRGRRHGIGVQFLEIVEGRESLLSFLSARPGPALP